MNKTFISAVNLRRAQGIKKGRKKAPKWLYPINQERQYQRILYSLVKDIKEKIRDIIIPEIPSMIYEVEQKTPQDRQDQYLDRLKSLIIYVAEAIQDKLNITIAESQIVGAEIARFNKKQFSKINEAVFGVDIFISEPWLSDQLSLFAAQNAQLIKSIPALELERVAGDIERGLQQGSRFTDVAREIQKSFGISQRKAKLIARDQTSKLNASLTKLRQTELGVEEYEWQTSGDERVRPTHRANDGKTFRWDTPPKTGHPGHDINCRCVAIAKLDHLLNL